MLKNIFVKNFFNIGFILLFLTLNIAAQDSTFSKVYYFDPHYHSNFNSVLVTDTCYFITGITTDTIFPYNPGALFLKTDLNGNVILMKGLTDTLHRYETWFQSLYEDADGNLATHGYDYTFQGNNNFFIQYDQNGNVRQLKYIQIDSTALQLIPYDMTKCMNGDYIIATANFDFNRPIYNITNFTRIDKNGNPIWNKGYELTPPQSLLHRLSTTKDGGAVVGSWGDETPKKWNNKIHQTVLTKIDSLGNQNWVYYSPTNEDWSGALGGVVVNDADEIVFGTGKGTSYVNGGNEYTNWDWCVTKMDKNRKILWRTFFNPFSYISVEGATNLWKMIQLRDKSGYISVGKSTDTSGFVTYPGWVIKVGENGDSLWSRVYNFDTWNANYWLRDVKEDKQGNLIMVGEINDIFTKNGRQYGWMIKADKYGCIVPGCHTVSTQEGAIPENKLIVYPNPAVDFIQFYVNMKNNSPIQYEIRNEIGEVVKPITKIQNDMTQIIYASNLVSGLYYLLLYQDNQLVKTEKIIITK